MLENGPSFATVSNENVMDDIRNDLGIVISIMAEALKRNVDLEGRETRELQHAYRLRALFNPCYGSVALCCDDVIRLEALLDRIK